MARCTIAKVTFALVPYPLQQQIIDDVRNSDYRFFPVAFGRQSGKSWLDKYLLLDSAINHDMTCILVAPAIPSARTHWNDIVKLIGKSKMKGVNIDKSAKEITFEGGGSITVRSAIEPDNIRGGSVDLIIADEAAFFRNGEYVWYSVLLPMVSATGGKVVLSSTPNGRNWFYQIFKQGQREQEKYYKSYHATAYISPYQDKELLDELSTTMPTYQWREEFLAEFLADSGGVFTNAEKRGVVKSLRKPEPGHDYVAGIDFGFSHDATVFTVLDKYTRQQVYGYRFYSEGSMDTIRVLVSLLNFWQPELTHLEKNGLGESYFSLLKTALGGQDEMLNQMLDDMEGDDPVDPEEQGSDPRIFRTQWGGKVRALHIDNKEKRKLVERLAADIEFNRLEILESVPGEYGEIQLNEMSTYIRERTQSGLELTYNAAEGSMDDTVSALYLAYKGVPRPPKFKKHWEEKYSDEPRKNPFKRTGKLRDHRKGKKQSASSD